GGDGGRGGDVILRATDQINTLYDIARRPEYKAERGGDGGVNDRHGSDGEHLVLSVPVGTLVRDAKHGHVLRDLLNSGDQVRIVKGGKGGRGNRAFASATRQVPRYREEGRAGQDRELVLELRLVADIGLVGLPNAGKSTFLSRVSKARPKIAGYPFTTVEPMLGVVPLGEWKRMVIADLPGLIEGASDGAGLGHKFLRHAGRTRMLIHLVAARPLEEPSPAEAWRVVRGEIEQFDPEMARRPELVVLSKCDLTGWEEDREELEQACGTTVYPVSSVAGTGLTEVLTAAAAVLDRPVDGSADEPAGETETDGGEA
ncbi:MAG: Obg family GTPase CgtA, partial [Planctomycetota bacterium]